MMAMTHGTGLAGLLLLVGCAGPGSAPAHSGLITPPPAFAMRGSELRRPEGFHEWVHVGTAVTPAAMNSGSVPFPGFHSVYLDPASFAHWQSAGEFRDGAVLVKQLASVGATEEVSGKGYFMGNLGKLEVAVKSRAQFAGEPGSWAYFEFDGDAQTAPKKAAARCNACHRGAGTQDFVFTAHYPILRAAKGE
jgi:hypothetical protein